MGAKKKNTINKPRNPENEVSHAKARNKCMWDSLKVSISVLTDGMFGKCHSVPVKEVYTYDVSPSVVQRFRILLEKLSNRGTHSECSTADTVLLVVSQEGKTVFCFFLKFPKTLKKKTRKKKIAVETVCVMLWTEDL